MREEHRKLLREIVGMLVDFTENPTEDGLTAILGALKALIKAVEATQYEGIELAVLRYARTILTKEARPLLGVRASLTTLHAVADEQRQALAMLAKVPPAVTPWTFALETAPPPPSAITISTYVFQGERFWMDGTPDATFGRVGFTTGLVLLRDAGVTWFDLSRTAALTLDELTILCNAARRAYGHHHEFGETVCNLQVQILAPGSTAVVSTLCARLVITRARTHIYLSYESRTIPQAVATGISLDQVSAQLCTEFQLKEVKAGDCPWSVNELLEVQAAFMKIPFQDRGALRNLVLLRRHLPVSDPGDTKHTAASYTPATHTLTVLDRCFQERRTFVGGGLDVFPYSHMVILHEVGHSLEPWFETAKIAPAVPLETLKADIDRIKQRLAELGKQLGASPGLADVQQQLAQTQDQLWAANLAYAIAFTRSLHGNGCLTVFCLKVQELHFSPVTDYAWSEWPGKPYEFWAESYALFLTDPAALEFVSPQLYRWFRDGGYRVGPNAAGLALLPAGSLTAGQVGAIQDLQSKLDALSFALEKATAVSPEFLAQMRDRLDRLSKACAALNVAMSTQPAELVDHLITGQAVQELLDDVAARFANGAPALVPADLPALKLVCDRERGALASLATTPQPPVAASPKRVTSRNCVITLGVGAGGAGTVAVGAEPVATALPLLPMSGCLVALRERGVRAVKLFGCTNLSAAERAWLCNAARRVYADCGSRTGIAIDTAIAVPSSGTIYFVRITFSTSGTLRLRLVGMRAAGAAAPQPPSLPQIQTALRTQFGIGEIVGDKGAAWTAAELVQVCDAFALLPQEDRYVLRGCRLVRKAMASGAQVWDADAERRRRGTYQPDTNTLIVLDSVFADADGFIGFNRVTRPRSHFHLLRLVGYAVAAQGDPEVVRRFAECVAGLQVQPMTEDVQTWTAAVQPLDFFAEAYSLCLNEPVMVQWVSEALAEWLVKGAYRPDA